MGRRFQELAFTPLVKQHQQEHGSRRQYERMAEQSPSGNTLGPDEQAFIAWVDLELGPTEIVRHKVAALQQLRMIVESGDRQIVVDAPDLRGREGILRVHLRNKPVADDVVVIAETRVAGDNTSVIRLRLTSARQVRKA